MIDRLNVAAASEALRNELSWHNVSGLWTKERWQQNADNGHRRSHHYRTRVTYAETWPGWAQGSSHDPLQIHNLLRWEIQHSDYATTTNGNHHATDAYKQLLYHQESQEKSKRWAQDEKTGSSQVQDTGTQWFGGNDELGERSQQISAMAWQESMAQDLSKDTAHMSAFAYKGWQRYFDVDSRLVAGSTEEAIH